MKITSARWAGGELILTTSDQEAIRFPLGFKEGNYTISRVKKPRSNDANAMYWSILTQLAKAVGVSNAYMHNRMLRLYGKVKTIDGKIMYVVLPDTEEAEDKVDNDETVHLKPTSQTRRGKDGVSYRTYMMLRGSSELDTAEFSALLDGLISECRDVGLDVLSERERSLVEAWDAERVRC